MFIGVTQTKYHFVKCIYNLPGCSMYEVRRRTSLMIYQNWVTTVQKKKLGNQHNSSFFNAEIVLLSHLGFIWFEF